MCRWVALVVIAFAVEVHASKIDRHALVTRHNIVLTNADALTPLSVGNGEFAFTADVTGLQTFPEFHEKGMMLSTMSQWGWHSFPNPQKYTPGSINSGKASAPARTAALSEQPMEPVGQAASAIAARNKS